MHTEFSRTLACLRNAGSWPKWFIMTLQKYRSDHFLSTSASKAPGLRQRRCTHLNALSAYRESLYLSFQLGQIVTAWKTVQRFLVQGEMSASGKQVDHASLLIENQVSKQALAETPLFWLWICSVLGLHCIAGLDWTCCCVLPQEVLLARHKQVIATKNWTARGWGGSVSKWKCLSPMYSSFALEAQWQVADMPNKVAFNGDYYLH